MKKIIYIAGYSRSGSTILDLLLSSHGDIFGTGELTYLFDDWEDENRVCTCGKRYDDCSFWGDFKLPDNISMAEAIKVIRRVESRKHLAELEGDTMPKVITEQYGEIQNALYSHIFKKSNVEFIVDSSKTSRDMAGRFYALQRYTDFDVYVIHLVKNGMSIVESYVKKGRNWALEGHGNNDFFPAIRSSIGWKLANRIAERLGEKMPERYLRINYENLVQEPRVILRQLGDFLGIEMTEVIKNAENSEALVTRHNVGGNRLRLENEVKFKPAKSDKSRVNRLSVFHRIIFKILTNGLNKKYKY